MICINTNFLSGLIDFLKRLIYGAIVLTSRLSYLLNFGDVCIQYIDFLKKVNQLILKMARENENFQHKCTLRDKSQASKIIDVDVLMVLKYFIY